MSSVDERVVEMRFDNQQFEQGVQQSLKTLDELKGGLKLEQSAKSLENLQTTADSLDFSGIATGVDHISFRVSALGIVGDQVIRTLTTKFLELASAAERTVKSLTIDQVGEGYDKYERKIQATQQIMNATGQSVEEVEGYLEELMWYSDETSYSFVDMADNMARFISSGVDDPKVAVTAMIGIGNAAGLAGASVGDASHAMEGFSKAIAQGSMNRQNWQWIKTAHMDTAQFKETMMDAAAAAGTLTKSVNTEGEAVYKTTKGTAVSVADFESAMSEGWLTTEAMISALEQFGGASEEIFKLYQEAGGEKTTSDIIDEMGDGLDELGIKAFKASQEAKTFTDALNSVKDAVSSGWMRTFQYIFGNKDEATKLWTTVANEMWDVFAGSGEERNDILAEWYEAGGRTKLIQAVSDSWQGIKSIAEAAKMAFNGLIPDLTGSKLMAITDKISEFASKFKDMFVVPEAYKELLSSKRLLVELRQMAKVGEISEEGKHALKVIENLEKLKKAFGGLKSIVKLIGAGFKALGRIFSPILELFHIGSGSILDFAAGVGTLLTNISNAIIKSKALHLIVEGLRTVVSGIAIAIKFLIGAITDLASAINKSGIFTRIYDWIEKFATSDFIQRIAKIFRSIFSLLAKINYKSAIKSLTLRIGSIFVTAFNRVKNSSIAKAIKGFFNSLLSSNGFIKSIKEFWNNLFPEGFQISSFADKANGIKDAFSGIKESIGSFLGNGKFLEIWDSFKQTISDAKEKIVPALDSIGEALANADWGKVVAIVAALMVIPLILQIASAFSAAAKMFKGVNDFVKETTNVVKGISTIPTKIGKTFDALTDAIKNRFKPKIVQFAEAAIGFAAAILILAGALKLISTINQEDLTRSGIALGSIAAGLFAMTLILGVMSSKGKFDKVSKAAIGIAALAGAILILSGALFVLKSLSLSQIISGTGAIIVLMAAITAFAAIFASADPKLSGSWKIFLAFAASIFILVEAIKVLSSIENIDWEASIAAILALTFILSSFAIIQRLAGKSKRAGFGVFAMMLSLFGIMKILDILGTDKAKEYVKTAKDNVGLIIGLFGALAVLAGISRIGGSSSAKTGFGILAAAVAINLIYLAVKKIGKLRASTLLKGIFGVVVLLAAFRRFAKALSTGNGGKASKVGASVIAMSASMLLIGIAVKKLGNLDFDVMSQGILGVIEILAAFAGSMRLMPENVKAGPIIAMVLAVITLIAGISLLTLYDPLDLLKSVFALGAIMLAFGGALGLIGHVSFDKTKIIAFGEGLVALIGATAALYILKDISWKQLISSAGSISVVLGSLSGSLWILSKSKFTASTVFSSIGGILLGIGAFYAIGLMLKHMGSDIPWQQYAGIGTSISGVLIALVAAMKIASIGGSAATLKASMFGLLGVMGWVVGLAMLMGVLSWAADLFQANEKDVQNVILIGQMIGGFAGALIGSFVSGMTIDLPAMAENLSSFIEKLQPFIDAVTNFPEGFVEKFQSFSDAINTIGSADLNYSISEVLMSILHEDLDSSFSENIKSLGQALNEFNSALSGVNPDELLSNVSSLEILVNSFNNVPTTGGIFDWTSGKIDIETFKNGLSGIGEAISLFAEKASDLNLGGLILGSIGFKTLMDMFNQIPPTSVFAKWFSGTIKWDTVSTGLVQFGMALRLFSIIVKGIDVSGIPAATEGAGYLADLESKIPPVGGMEQALEGHEEWKTITEGLTDFGTALVDFAGIVKGFNGANDIKNAATAAGALADLENAIPPAEGVWQDIFGEKSWGTLSGGLVGLATNIILFNTLMSSLGDGGVDAATSIIEDLLATLGKINDGTILGFVNGDVNMGLTGVYEKFSQFGENMKLVDTSGIYDVAEAIGKIPTSVYDSTTFVDSGESIGNAVLSGINTSLTSDSATAIPEDFITLISGGFSEQELSANTLGSDLGEIVANGFLSGIGSGLSSVGSAFMGKINMAFIFVKMKMMIVGMDVAQGFINGMRAKDGEVYLAGYKMGLKAKDGVKDAVKSNSPSKETILIGQYMGDGLVIGLNSMQKKVEDASYNMGKSSVLAVSSVFDGIDALLSGDGDYSPVISPVLDLTDLSYGASQIGSILNHDAAVNLSGNLQSVQNVQNVQDLLRISGAILEEIQNGHDLYFDDGAFAGRINRRLGSI